MICVTMQSVNISQSTNTGVYDSVKHTGHLWAIFERMAIMAPNARAR